MWPSRSRLPESVRELDHDRVVAALVVCNVNISAAAKKLHVPSADLRSLMAVSPELLALAAEREERRLDKAEAILERELDSDDPRYSAAAAFFVLRNAKRAVARGWRQPDVEVAVASNGPPVRCNILWGDGSRIATVEYPAGTLLPRPLEIEHDPRDGVAAVEEKPGEELASGGDKTRL
jgi:hypothetical protein